MFNYCLIEKLNALSIAGMCWRAQRSRAVRNLNFMRAYDV